MECLVNLVEHVLSVFKVWRKYVCATQAENRE